MSDIAMNRQRSRAEVLYCLDVLVRHLSDEGATEGWLADGIPDGTLEKWPTEEQVGPFLDYAEDENVFDNLAKTALAAVYGSVFVARLKYVAGSLS